MEDVEELVGNCGFMAVEDELDELVGAVAVVDDEVVTLMLIVVEDVGDDEVGPSTIGETEVVEEVVWAVEELDVVVITSTMPVELVEEDLDVEEELDDVVVVLPA